MKFLVIDAIIIVALTISSFYLPKINKNAISIITGLTIIGMEIYSIYRFDNSVIHIIITSVRDKKYEDMYFIINFSFFLIFAVFIYYIFKRKIIFFLIASFSIGFFYLISPNIEDFAKHKYIYLSGVNKYQKEKVDGFREDAESVGLDLQQALDRYGATSDSFFKKRGIEMRFYVENQIKIADALEKYENGIYLLRDILLIITIGQNKEVLHSYLDNYS